MLQQEWVINKNRNLCVVSNCHMPVKNNIGVVFFPGFSQTKAGAYSLFTQIVNAIDCHCYVVLFDYIGCGDSQGESYETDLDSMVHDGKRVINWFYEKVYCEKYFFIGHGSGNMVASIVGRNINTTLILLAPHYKPISKNQMYAAIKDKIKKQLLIFDTADLDVWSEETDNLFSLLGGRLNRAKGIIIKKKLLLQLLNFNLEKMCRDFFYIHSFVTETSPFEISKPNITEHVMATQDVLFMDMLVREDLIRRINKIILEFDVEKNYAY